MASKVTLKTENIGLDRARIDPSGDHDKEIRERDPPKIMSPLATELLAHEYSSTSQWCLLSLSLCTLGRRATTFQLRWMSLGDCQRRFQGYILHKRCYYA